ncbi:MAG: hypothetical protein Devi2KO_25770 [Devosia indica]
MFGFLLAYIFSDIFGALVLFYRLEPFYSVFIYHSGIALPATLSAGQMLTFWLVAIGSPFIMIAAFFATFFPTSRKLRRPGPPEYGYDPPFWIVLLVFGVLVYFAARSLEQAGAFDLLGTWGNYADLVEARWGLFATLSFFEFANFYQFIPVVAIVALLVGLEQRGWGRVVGLVCAFVAVLIGVMIFQKKAVLITMLMLALALMVRSYFVDPKRVARLVGLAGASLLALALVFFTASVVPTLTSQQSTVGNASNTTQKVDFVEEWRKRSAEIAASGGSVADASATAELDLLAAQVLEQAAQNEFRNNPLIVAIVNLTMRTSVPAVYYIAVFPDLHPYYSLDLGQDIIGIGAMPNDNFIVWNQMYPEMPGVVAAPFNFVLFSQGGLWVVMAMSAITGLVLGVIWALILRSSGSMAVRAAIGAVVVVGTMHLALDALRNSVIVSYGFAWGLMPLLVLLLIGRVAGRRRKERAGTVALSE